MDEITVNRLNGVPNFGHGFPEKSVEEVIEDVLDVEIEEVKEEKVTKRKKK